MVSVLQISGLFRKETGMSRLRQVVLAVCMFLSAILVSLTPARPSLQRIPVETRIRR